jgi:hypothetical protein
MINQLWATANRRQLTAGGWTFQYSPSTYLMNLSYCISECCLSLLPEIVLYYGRIKRVSEGSRRLLLCLYYFNGSLTKVQTYRPDAVPKRRRFAASSSQELP